MLGVCGKHSPKNTPLFIRVILSQIEHFYYGPVTLARMPFRLFSEYEFGCSGSERIIFGKHSLCSRSILAVRLRTNEYGMAFGRSKNVLCMFKIIVIDHPNVASMCIREIFGKHSRSIRHVRKTSGKHASLSWCIRNEHLEVLGSICFLNTPNRPKT